MQSSSSPDNPGQSQLGHPPERRLGGREALFLSLRAAAAGSIAFVCYRWTGLPVAFSAPVSAVLVMEPTLRPSLRASLIRFAGNVVGALCGAAGSLTLGPTPLAILAGLLVTGTLCHYLRLDDGRRPAYVATLIVLTNNVGGTFHSIGDRLVAVMIGCVVALGVAFACDRLLKQSNLESGGSDPGE